MSNVQTKEKKMNPILWFLFAIVVPGTVLILLAVVIMSFAGVNVGDWVKKTGSTIPVVSSFIKTEEEQSIEELEQKLSTVIEEKDLHITSLEETVEQHVTTIDRLTDEVLVAEQQLLSNEEIVESADDTEEDTAVPIKEMAASYKEMNHKQAARIIEEMDETIALLLLDELPNDVRGKILEKMDPAHAVLLTESYMQR